MIDIERIKSPIKKEMHQFDELFASIFITDNALLSQVYSHILSTKGKQIRPVLSLLTAKLCGGITKATLLSSVALELLHSASLLHDDVVDDTHERRGERSVNSMFSNKIAVLSGDHLLSLVISLVAEVNRKEVLNAISALGQALAEGELLQLSQSQDASFEEDKYLEIITKKTAVLFSTCTLVGALSADSNEPKIEDLRLFGEYLGLCFQIKDDIFDYSDSKEIGKPTANDIREKKITLPLLHAFSKASDSEKLKIKRIIAASELSNEEIDYLIAFAKSNGGIEYAEKLMLQYREKAVGLLKQFDNDAVKKSLIEVLDYAINRKK